MKYEKPSVAVFEAAEVIQGLGKPGIQQDANHPVQFNSTAAYEADE